MKNDSRLNLNVIIRSQLHLTFIQLFQLFFSYSFPLLFRLFFLSSNSFQSFQLSSSTEHHEPTCSRNAPFSGLLAVISRFRLLIVYFWAHDLCDTRRHKETQGDTVNGSSFNVRINWRIFILNWGNQSNFPISEFKVCSSIPRSRLVDNRWSANSKILWKHRSLEVYAMKSSILWSLYCSKRNSLKPIEIR